MKLVFGNLDEINQWQFTYMLFTTSFYILFLGVIFNMTEDGSMPNHMTYKIRQNASFTTTTNLVRSRFWFPGPRNWGYGYYQFGFVWIQVWVLLPNLRKKYYI